MYQWAASVRDYATGPQWRIYRYAADGRDDSFSIDNYHSNLELSLRGKFLGHVRHVCVAHYLTRESDIGITRDVAYRLQLLSKYGTESYIFT